MITFDPPSPHPLSETVSIKIAVRQDIMKRENKIREASIETSKGNMQKETNLLCAEIDEQLHIIFGDWPTPESTERRIITKKIYKGILEEEARLSPSEIAEYLATHDELWLS